MDHECIYKEDIIDNIKNIASIEQQTKNNSEKLDKLDEKLDEKLDSIIVQVQSLKIKEAKDVFVQNILKTAAVVVVCLVTNIFWNNVATLFTFHH